MLPLPSPPEAEGSGLFDDTEVDTEGRLLVRCEDVPEAAADLANPECLRAVLRRLRDEASAKGVMLVHDREKAYGDRAMAILESLLSLGRLLDQFGQRAPAPNFHGFTAREVEAVCAKCEFRPAAMFAKLRDELLGDPRQFLAALKELAAALDAYTEDGCRACIASTFQDLRLLVQEIEAGKGG